MNSRLPGIEPSSSWRADFGGEAKYLSLCRGTEIVCGGCTKGERCSRGEVTLGMRICKLGQGNEGDGEPMADKYTSYEALRRRERENFDYRIRIVRRESAVAIIAPHGGWIEPETSVVAEAIAGDDHNLYCFEGLRDRPHGDLHVTSTNFDEPQCLELVSTCDQVVAVHGMAGRNNQHVEVGGLDAVVRDAVCKELGDAGYAATVVTSGRLAARSALNICNRGARKAGVQLEITRGLRDALRKDAANLRNFANAVQSALREHKEL